MDVLIVHDEWQREVKSDKSIDNYETSISTPNIANLSH